MPKTYWVMKSPGSTAEWIEMTGKQFYNFITSPDGKGRYFMDCGAYKIEVSPKQYRDWKREANHSSYLQGFEDEVLILSLEAIAEENIISDNDLADLSVNIEYEAINNTELQRLSEALLSLSDDELRLIYDLFLRGKPKTEQEIATSNSISQQAVHKQKTKILKKLKMLVVKF